MSEAEQNELKDKYDIAHNCLKQLWHGFAGMFGNQTETAQQDFYNRGRAMVVETMDRLGDVEKHGATHVFNSMYELGLKHGLDIAERRAKRAKEVNCE